MENNLIDVEFDREKSLEGWLDEVIKPILSAIGHITSHLNNLMREIK